MLIVDGNNADIAMKSRKNAKTPLATNKTYKKESSVLKPVKLHGILKKDGK